MEVNTFTGDIKHNVDVKGDITHNTKIGDVTMETLKGNVNVKTLSGDAVLSGQKVQLGGSGGAQAVVCGDLLMEILSAIVDALMALTVPTPTGPSGPPTNMADFVKAKALISSKYALSTFITCQKIWTP